MIFFFFKCTYFKLFLYFNGLLSHVASDTTLGMSMHADAIELATMLTSFLVHSVIDPMLYFAFFF